ncbi:hypothetical protein GF377_03545 [candidate division GN15 bacterium]|nr:hypothetical protein [candidate division GN15 bacterium]
MAKTGRILAAVAVTAIVAVLAYFLYDTLRERSVPEKLAAIAHAEDQRMITPTLEELLADDSVRVRARAAVALGRIDAPRSGEMLAGMLRDEAITVARSAAFGMGLTQEKRLADQLVDVALDLPSPVTAKAVEAAGRLADSSMTNVGAALVEFLSHPSPDVREAACYALFRANAKKFAQELIPFLAQEPDSLVQVAALYALARLGIAEAYPVFVEFQAESDPYTRTLAVRGLASVKSDESARQLAVSLNDSDKRVVAQAIFGLRSVGTQSAAKYLANKLTKTTDQNLILALLASLEALESKLAVSTARTQVTSNLSPFLVAASVSYLATIQGDKTVDLLDSLLSTTPPARVRAACADAFGKINHKGIVPRLSLLFADEDPLVRASAFSSLVAVDSTNIEFYLDKALADRDFMPVVLAIDQIGQRKLEKYLPDLLEFMFAGEQVDVDIRRSVIDAASQFHEKLGPDSLLMAILASGIIDSRYAVRKAAADVYKEKLQESRYTDITPVETRLAPGRIEEAIETAGVAGNPTAVIVTSKGEIEIELYADIAPLTVVNFMQLAKENFYTGLIFHRVVPNFVVQGGDPRGDGWGGPDWFIRCEYSDEAYIRGTVGIATSGKDTGGSQFFITHSPQPHLDGRYTVFGQVTGGMEVVDQIAPGDIIQQILIQEG